MVVLNCCFSSLAVFLHLCRKYHASDSLTAHVAFSLSGWLGHTLVLFVKGQRLDLIVFTEWSGGSVCISPFRVVFLHLRGFHLVIVVIIVCSYE
jgi:hypothetical protein